MRQIYSGKIAGAFYGFNSNQLFKLANGTYWIQSKYRYWYHYKYRPQAVIVEVNGQFILTVEGQSIPVRRVHEVWESRIAGRFEGWRGDTIYKLENRQIWQQSVYKYEYKYALRPDAIVFKLGSRYIMRVVGTEAEVRPAS